MNKEKVLETADFIEQLSDKLFNMDTFGETQPCGTVACIAGWVTINDGARLMDSTIFIKNGERVSAFGHARDILDLDYIQCERLFLPPMPERRTFTKEQAVKTLRNLAETGDVNWRTE